MKEFSVPDIELNLMLGATARDAAALILREWKPGHAMHPGDQFGRVLEWVWTVDQEKAVQMVKDVLYELRNADNPKASLITREILLGGLGLALGELPEQEAERMMAELERRGAA